MKGHAVVEQYARRLVRAFGSLCQTDEIGNRERGPLVVEPQDNFAAVRVDDSIEPVGKLAVSLGVDRFDWGRFGITGVGGGRGGTQSKCRGQ